MSRQLIAKPWSGNVCDFVIVLISDFIFMQLRGTTRWGIHFHPIVHDNTGDIPSSLTLRISAFAFPRSFKVIVVCIFIISNSLSARMPGFISMLSKSFRYHVWKRPIEYSLFSGGIPFHEWSISPLERPISHKCSPCHTFLLYIKKAAFLNYPFNFRLLEFRVSLYFLFFQNRIPRHHRSCKRPARPWLFGYTAIVQATSRK